MFPLAPSSVRALNYLEKSHPPLQNSIRFNDKILPLSVKDNHKPPNSFRTRLNNQNRLIPQQPNLETKQIKHVLPLINSRLSHLLPNRIQNERRAHTMAPASQISGPIPTPRGNMFATTKAPVDNHSNPSSKISYETSNDDAPIIIKVRYDPQVNGVPSEDAIRKAIKGRIFDGQARKEPIIIDFLNSNSRQPEIQQNLSPNFITNQLSRHFPPTPHPSRRILPQRNDHVVQITKKSVNKSKTSPLHKMQLTRRKRTPIRTQRIQSKGLKTTNQQMATQQQPSTINNQQILTNRANLAPSSGEVFRPPSINDIPELSRDNILNMLNQIPDLQGRRFNIEYAPSNAPEGYPIPLNIDANNNSYPEPVIIDQLPSNVIQHIKSSNNPALTAALEATIRQEQSQPTVPSLNIHPPTVMHHAAQPSQQVQKSRPASSDESNTSSSSSSSTDVSSSDTSSSSSEETDSEESESSQNRPFVGPMPPTFFSQNHHC